MQLDPSHWPRRLSAFFFMLCLNLSVRNYYFFSLNNDWSRDKMGSEPDQVWLFLCLPVWNHLIYISNSLHCQEKHPCDKKAGLKRKQIIAKCTALHATVTTSHAFVKIIRFYSLAQLCRRHQPLQKTKELWWVLVFHIFPYNVWMHWPRCTTMAALWLFF